MRGGFFSSFLSTDLEGGFSSFFCCAGVAIVGCLYALVQESGVAVDDGRGTTFFVVGLCLVGLFFVVLVGVGVLVVEGTNCGKEVGDYDVLCRYRVAECFVW